MLTATDSLQQLQALNVRVDIATTNVSDIGIQDRLVAIARRLEGLGRNQLCAQVITRAGLVTITPCVGYGLLTFVASLRGQDASWLTLDEDNATLLAVYTEQHLWRKGLARALYEHAVGALGPIAHSEYRSPAGNSWAIKVGGYLPEHATADWD